jgi:hypothetical protein
MDIDTNLIISHPVGKRDTVLVPTSKRHIQNFQISNPHAGDPIVLPMGPILAASLN